MKIKLLNKNAAYRSKGKLYYHLHFQNNNPDDDNFYLLTMFMNEEESKKYEVGKEYTLNVS